MLIYKPAYFDQFCCLAASCPDSCCKEWDVQVDPDSAAFYRNLPGPLGDRLRQVLRDDPEYGTLMAIENGRCPMWQADGLCRIQAELGHDSLCKTCRDFPRLTHDYGDFLEFGLELSCPEAARIILTSPALPNLVEEVPGGDIPDYDRADMEILRATRETALQLLASPAYTVPESLILLLFYGYQVQTILDGGEAPDFVPEEILRTAKELAAPSNSTDLLQFFSDLEILTDTWRHLLQNPQESTWDEMLQNLARYGVERYWLQAISDFDLVARVKMVVVSCLLVKTLGGDPIATAQMYSKEIENNADNVDAILDAAYESPALTDDKLLGLLLAKGPLITKEVI